MTAEDLLEQVRIFLPQYLSQGQQEELWKEIRAFPTIRSFYLPEGAVEADLLQGDGWRGFLAVNFETMEKKPVSALIVSNSCDIDLSNKRPLPALVLFSPLITLSAYADQLRRAGESDPQIEGRLATIRRQEISNIFYLPERGGGSEGMVLLDNLHQQQVNQFIRGERSRLFRLHQVAWYLFLIKLSIHFTRSNEGVARFPLAPA